jgi:hypothetical protein
MNRPTGVSILAILGILWGGFVAFIGLILLFGSAMAARFMDGMPRFFVGFGVAVLAAILLVYGVLHILVGVGLLNLADWARVLSIVLAVIHLAFTVLALLPFPFLILFAFRRLFMCAIDILIIWYLSQPHIKQAFSRQRSAMA